MSKIQQPPVRIIGFLVLIIALVEIALWFYLEPSSTTSQDVMPIDRTPVSVTAQAATTDTVDSLFAATLPTMIVELASSTPQPPNHETATSNDQYATAVAYVTAVNSAVTVTVSPMQSAVTPRSNATNSSASQPDASKPPNTSTEESPHSPTATATPIPTSTATPTFTPIATPTESPTTLTALEYAPVPETVEAETIRFEIGATSAIVGGSVDYDQPVRYILSASEGQPMSVLLQNQSGDVAQVDISTEDGDLLGSSQAGETWSGVLPATQNYYLTIRVPAGGTGHEFSLWVEILP